MRRPPAADAPGVYVVPLTSNPLDNGGLLPKAPIDEAKVRAGIDRVPTFCFRGRLNPDPAEVTEFLNEFWLRMRPSSVYIGKATCISKRLHQLYRHELGQGSPHAGGHWLKTLSNLGELYIHYCTCPTAGMAQRKEDEALAAFKAQVSARWRSRIHNAIPYANRAHPTGFPKQREIRNDVLA